MEHTLYHSLLRVGATVAALVLVFDSGLLSTSTRALSDGTQHYLANAVSVQLGVAPTELSEYTAKLTAMESDLKAREAALAEREIAVSLNTGEAAGAQRDVSTYVLSTILFILLVLIVLNYALDYLRTRRPVPTLYGEQQPHAS